MTAVQVFGVTSIQKNHTQVVYCSHQFNLAENGRLILNNVFQTQAVIVLLFHLKNNKSQIILYFPQVEFHQVGAVQFQVNVGT